MQQATGNIWEYWNIGYWVVITTNGFVKANGECVMGRGTAKQAANRFPELPLAVGKQIRENGNKPFVFDTRRIITLPVKHNWWEPADLGLISRSTVRLVNIVNLWGLERVAMPRPGCGNGQLTWAAVERVIGPLLDERFTIVQL